MKIETLQDAARSFELSDSEIRNHQLARKLSLDQGPGDEEGMPRCCFFRGERLVAIRVNRSELVVFNCFASVRHHLMSQRIALPIGGNS